MLTNNRSISARCCLSQAERSELSSSVYATVMNDASLVSYAIKVNHQMCSCLLSLPVVDYWASV